MSKHKELKNEPNVILSKEGATLTMDDGKRDLVLVDSKDKKKALVPSGPSFMSVLGRGFATALTAVKERILGDDYWIPTDPTEIVVFPHHVIRSHPLLLPETDQKYQTSKENPACENSVFAVCQGIYKNRPDRPIFHVTFTWGLEGAPFEERKTKLAKVSTEGSDSESDGERTLSIFRCEDVHLANDLYQSCLHCQQLFLLLTNRKELKRELKGLLAKLHQHPLWDSVHVAAQMGTVQFFLSRQSQISHELMLSLLGTASQPEGMYPLQIAIEAHQLELVRLLLNFGDNIGRTDVRGANALHYAARASAQMVELLCDRPEAKALLNSLDRDGCTPLLVAIRCGNPLCLAALMRAGAELNITGKGRSPLHYAMQQSGTKVRDVIKAILSEVGAETANVREPATGNAPIHAATNKTPLAALLFLAADTIDLNIRNTAGQTALHVHTHREDLGCVITVAGYGIDLDAQDSGGSTALHIAVAKSNVLLTKALLVLGADPNVLSGHGHSVRHIAAKLNSKNKLEIVRCLSLCGAGRCPPGKIGCAVQCADRPSLQNREPSATSSPENSRAGTPTNPQLFLENDKETIKPRYKLEDVQAFKNQQCIDRITKMIESGEKVKFVKLLSLDGGGIRGLIIAQILLCIEKELGARFWDYFDWTAGTSTGSFVCAGLAKGMTLREVQNIYLRFKDRVFEGWVRPYDTQLLEDFIKRELGEETTLEELLWPRMIITTVKADKHPVSLELFRNYSMPFDRATNEAMGFKHPSNVRLWKALRCSSAAPTYFTSVDRKYVDGGLVANNPSCDLISEVQTYNDAIQFLGRPQSEMVEMAALVSIGTGRIPDMPVESLDIGIGTSGLLGSAVAAKNLSLIMIDMASATEGAPVDRSRSWCHAKGTPFFRFTTPMSLDVPLDTNEDTDVVHIMWDTVEYMHKNREQLLQFVQFLRLLGPSAGKEALFVETEN